MSRDPQRSAAEMLATADSLRSVRNQISLLIHEGHALPTWGAVRTVLVEGYDVAQALETLAHQLAGVENVA